MIILFFRIFSLFIPINSDAACLEQKFQNYFSKEISIQTLDDSSLTIAQLLDKISQTVGTFSDSLITNYPAASPIADSIASDLKFMKERWKKGTGDPSRYKKNLLLILKMLQNPGTDTNQRVKLLLNTYEDIHLKADFCRNNSVGPGEVVSIKVKTKSGIEEVSGFQVVYILKIMQLANNPEQFTFPKFSSPTTESLAPGIYRAWVQKPGTNIKGIPVDLKVSGKESEYDLPVPEDK